MAGGGYLANRRAGAAIQELPPKQREVIVLRECCGPRLTDYLDGALSAAERARFEEHISGCDGCTAYLAQLRTTMSVVGRLAAEPIPEPVERDLLHAFRNWKSQLNA